jgi:hypothetical protein
MSEQLKPVFKTVSFVLIAIVMACGIFLGLLHKLFAPGLISGLALLSFVAVPHWIGLNKAIKQEATAAAIIIGMFASFWTFLGLTFVAINFKLATPEAMDAVLKMIEPIMIIVITLMALFYYRGNLRWILLVGLNVAILMLWLPKVGIYAMDQISHLALTRSWLCGLGSWALVTCLWEMRVKKVPE